MARPRISILLPTRNNAETIRDTLESVKWADEILVVDTYSSDRTLPICRAYGARVIQHEYVTSAKQKNWAVAQCRHEWALQIDSDEVLEPGLADEIKEAVASAPTAVHAFRIPRKNLVLGRWVRSCGIYPDYQTRLFRKDSGRWQDREVHAHVQVPGEIRELSHHIIHDSIVHISKQLRNVDRYARYEADELRKQKRKSHWWNLALRPPATFAYKFFWQGGFRDGYRGFILSVMTATFVFWKHAKLWEMETLELEASPRKWELY